MASITAHCTPHCPDASLREAAATGPSNANPPTGEASDLEASDPLAVLADPRLSEAEKRALLAAWASDANAVESRPGLRRRPGSRSDAVTVDAVLDALHRLDGDGDGTGSAPVCRPPPSPLRRAPSTRLGARRALH